MSEVRSKRIASTVRKYVCEKIMELDGNNIITITDVQVSPKYQFAKIYYTSFGSTEDKVCEDFLETNSFLIKKYLVKRLDLRYAIDIKFILDTSLENATKIERILSEISSKAKNELSTADE